MFVPLVFHQSTTIGETAKKHGIYLIGGSIPERDENGKIFNSCLIYDPQGQLVAHHRKVCVNLIVLLHLLCLHF